MKACPDYSWHLEKKETLSWVWKSLTCKALWKEEGRGKFGGTFSAWQKLSRGVLFMSISGKKRLLVPFSRNTDQKPNEESEKRTTVTKNKILIFLKTTLQWSQFLFQRQLSSSQCLLCFRAQRLKSYSFQSRVSLAQFDLKRNSLEYCWKMLLYALKLKMWFCVYLPTVKSCLFSPQQGTDLDFRDICCTFISIFSNSFESLCIIFLLIN